MQKKQRNTVNFGKHEFEPWKKKRVFKATSKTFQHFHLIHSHHQGFGLASRSKQWLGLCRPCCMKIEAALWLIHPTGLFIRIPVTELATL